jgi:hypothetical protein
MLDFVAYSLVEPSWVAAHLDDGDMRVVDARGLGDGTGEEWGTCSCRPNRSRRSWKRSRLVTRRVWSPTPKRTTPGRLDSGGRCATTDTTRWRSSTEAGDSLRDTGPLITAKKHTLVRVINDVH